MIRFVISGSDEDDDEDDDDEEDDDDDDEEEEDSDDEVEAPPAKQAKFDKNAKQNGLPNGKPAKNEQKQKNQPQQQQQQKNQKQDKQVKATTNLKICCSFLKTQIAFLLYRVIVLMLCPYFPGSETKQPTTKSIAKINTENSCWWCNH